MKEQITNAKPVVQIKLGHYNIMNYVACFESFVNDDCGTDSRKKCIHAHDTHSAIRNRWAVLEI